MSTLDSADVAAPGADVAGGRGRRTSWRLWATVAIALVAAIALAAWAGRGGPEHTAPLDPRNPGPDGAQAVAEVLADDGVEVEIARDADALETSAPDAATTVVVTSASSLAASAADRLLRDAAASRVILVDPSYATLRHVDPDAAGPTYATDVTTSCAPGPDAIRHLEGLQLVVDGADAYPGDGCFEADGGALLAPVDPDPATTEVWAFGAGEALTNDQVLRGDNAAVALRLLGQRDRLVWYVPDPADATADDAVGLSSLLPKALVPALVLTLLAGIALVLWRGRRFGPLSTEPLPVVVRATETARSRGRMYRRANDRAHAASALRAAARRDLAERLALPRTAADAERVSVLVDALARRTGRDPHELHDLLADGASPPTTDDDLLHLTRALHRLTREDAPS